MLRKSCTLATLLLLAACSGCAPATLPQPTEDLSGLSPEAITTLRSLEKVSDYPLYVMHAASGTIDPGMGWIQPQGSGFSCSLFATLGQTGDKLYGRNFDWEFSPALLLFTDPPDGYATVSMVDLTFLGIDAATAMSLTSLPLAERTDLLQAASMPFDGMNEYGLAIAMAA